MFLLVRLIGDGLLLGGLLEDSMMRSMPKAREDFFFGVDESRAEGGGGGEVLLAPEMILVK